MSVETVNGHVLLPHLPDWASPVAWQRAWQCQVGRAVGGSEGRLSVRERPRIRLGWRLDPVDVTEQSLLHARLRAARKSGYACVPYWGRGLGVVAKTGTKLTLAAAVWATAQADDWCLIRRLDFTAHDDYELVKIATYDGNEITLAIEPDDWAGDGFIWPLLYGQFTCGDISHRTDWHSPVSCQLVELATRAFEPPPEGPPLTLCTIEGVDFGDSFECYPVDWTGPYEGGNGWDGPWIIFEAPVPFGDTFEDYLITQNDHFNEGTGFTSGTSWSVLPEAEPFGDDMESYSVGANPAGGGTGFAGNWSIT